VRSASEHQIGIILDPALAGAVPYALLEDVDVLKPNGSEARAP